MRMQQPHIAAIGALIAQGAWSSAACMQRACITVVPAAKSCPLMLLPNKASLQFHID